jgi:hypothetical protein
VNGQQLFEIWAPAGSVWSRWAKPVLFAEAPPPVDVPQHVDWFEPSLLRVSETAVVVEFPGVESILEGVALAREGFRPVPLYNTSPHPQAIVDVQPIVGLLGPAARELESVRLPDTAPPAFLLDSLRLPIGASLTPGRFDNRWVVFPQDFPSGNFLLSQGIRRVVLLRQGTGQPAEDLAHVLLRWQEAGLQIFSFQRGQAGLPQPLEVYRPSLFRQLWYRSLTLLGLRRNSAGGFGSIIPQPSSGGG